MAISYIPANDDKALKWMRAFSNTLSGNPSTYDVSEADCVQIKRLVDDFGDAMAVVAEKATRTEVTVQQKDDARALAEQLCRSFAMRIKMNDGIDDADKIAAGVRPVNPDRQPVEAPAVGPLINVVGASVGTQTVRYADADSPERRGKPFGAQRIELFCAIGETATANVNEARYVGGFTRGPIYVTFDEADDGKVATYFARWANGKGQTSPWSLPTTMRVAA